MELQMLATAANGDSTRTRPSSSRRAVSSTAPNLSVRIAIVNAARCASTVFPWANSERTWASASCAVSQASSAPACFRDA
jgi:hypothetical protein